MNLAFEIIRQQGTSGRQAFFPANLRIKVPVLPTYRYPDLSVVCSEALFEQTAGQLSVN